MHIVQEPIAPRWISLYREKSRHGDDMDLADLPNLITHPDKGFLSYEYDPELEALFVVALCGDGDHWHDVVMYEAMRHGAKTIIGNTARSPRAYCRKWGFRVRSYILEREV